MQDRIIFLQNITKRRDEAKQAIIKQGVSCDDVLIKELNSPGTDRRNGVNIICRPNAEIAKYIYEVQDFLRELEPDQYYYPIDDLHLTLVEICHSRTLDEANLIAEKVCNNMEAVILNLPTPKLDCPTLAFDTRGSALNFLPTDDKLQATRQAMHARLNKVGVNIDPRYFFTSAHVSLMRYVRDLRSEPAKWVNCLMKISQQPVLTWYLDTAWLTWGANWYGMRSSITEKGPYRLGSV